MKRVGTISYALSGVLCLALLLAVTGVGQATAKSVVGAVQKVTISGGSVQAIPAAPSQPLQFGAQITATAASGEDTAVAYTVPAGRQLVIEFVSVDWHQSWSADYVQAGFSTGTGPTYVIPMSNLDDVGQSVHDFTSSGAMLTKVYAKAGEKVTMHLHHYSLSKEDLPTTYFAFSGYLLKA